MALSKESIENINNKISWLNSTSETLTNTTTSVKAALASDANYQRFVSGTDIGKKLNDDIQVLIDTAKNLNETAVKNLIIRYNSYVQTQEELNEASW